MEMEGTKENNAPSAQLLILGIIVILLVIALFFKLKAPKKISTPTNSTTNTSVTINKTVSPDFPKGLILEKNETLRYTSASTASLGQKSVGASYTTDKKMADVVKMYSDSLPKSGWIVLSKTETSQPKSVVIKATQDKQTLTLAFLALSDTKTALSFNLINN